MLNENETQKNASNDKQNKDDTEIKVSCPLNKKTDKFGCQLLRSINTIDTKHDALGFLHSAVQF